MKKIAVTLSTSLICAASTTVQAQQFSFNRSSKHFDVKIEIPCQQSKCQGPATITLYEKDTDHVLQQIESDDLILHLEQNSPNSIPKNEKNIIMFKDFNFDGSEDLAIHNGNANAYSGPSYDIYIFNEHWKKFVYNEELSELTAENLGMFQLDPHQKRIVSQYKSGCCYRVRAEYLIKPEQELILVREFIEDQTSSSKNQVKVTDRVLINGKWTQTVKYYPASEYYQ